MKKIIALSFALIAGLLIFSCSTDRDKTTVIPLTNPTVQSNKTEVVLNKEDGDKDAISFSFTNPTSNLGLPNSNQLEIALKGTNFAKSRLVNLPKDLTTVVFKTQEFNSLLLNLDLPTGVASNLEVRIKSSYSSLDGSPFNLPVVFSNVLPLSATPYTLASFLYVVGEFQGFNPATAQEIVSPTSNGIYEGTINFTAANSKFLILPTRVDYVGKYGSNDNFNLIKGGGADLFNVNVGPQKITVNTNNLTYTLTP